MNFFDFMRNTFVTNEPVWNYYGTEIYTDPVASPGRSAQFIQDYFLQGQKGDIVYELDAHHDVNIHGISILLSEYRATHTVSAFFLGIFLEDCLTQGQCGADLAVHGDFFPFSYLWFLTCLYHDYGYIVEENWKPSCRRYNEARICSLDGYYRLRNIKRELDIIYSPYQQITPLRRSVQRHNKSHRETHDRSTIISYLLGNSPSLKDGLQFACGATVTGFRYPQKLLMQYFSYGIHRLFPPCYNHGIIGGYLLFDRLLKVYESAYRHRYPEHGEEYAGIESFEWSGKHFCIEQIPVFAHIADCVISHNVWKANDASETEYLECGLEALVGERFKKIEFQENPLLFILAVVDTIEPYKIYSSKAADRDAVRIWKSIDISFTNNTLTLSSRYKCRPITKIYERAKGLEAWVDIESIELSSDRKSLRIKFK